MAFYAIWSCFYDKNTFMIHGKGIILIKNGKRVVILTIAYIIAFQIFEMKEQTNINRVYYICASITLFITFITIASFVAITRLLIFHVKLSKSVCNFFSYLFMIYKKKRLNLYPSNPNLL
jgi:hypothetical protein